MAWEVSRGIGLSFNYCVSLAIFFCFNLNCVLIANNSLKSKFQLLNFSRRLVSSCSTSSDNLKLIALYFKSLIWFTMVIPLFTMVYYGHTIVYYGLLWSYHCLLWFTMVCALFTIAPPPYSKPLKLSKAMAYGIVKLT